MRNWVGLKVIFSSRQERYKIKNINKTMIHSLFLGVHLLLTPVSTVQLHLVSHNLNENFDFRTQLDCKISSLFY